MPKLSNTVPTPNSHGAPQVILRGSLEQIRAIALRTYAPIRRGDAYRYSRGIQGRDEVGWDRTLVRMHAPRNKPTEIASNRSACEQPNIGHSLGTRPVPTTRLIPKVAW